MINSYFTSGEDAVEDSEDNPFAVGQPEHEHLYKDDPKKALKGFYEREGRLYWICDHILAIRLYLFSFAIYCVWYEQCILQNVARSEIWLYLMKWYQL